MLHKRVISVLCAIVFLSGPVALYPASPALQSTLDPAWISYPAPKISGGDILQISVDRNDPAHLYALHRDVHRVTSLVESTDGAASWESRSSFAFEEEHSLSQLAVDPVNAQVLYALDNAKLLRSPDGGRNWSEIHTQVSAIAAPAGGRVYALGSMDPGVHQSTCPTPSQSFLRSADHGDHWTRVSLGCYYLNEISTTVEHPDWIYLHAVDHEAAEFLLRSSDGGLTWDTLPLTGPYFTQGLTSLTVDPAAPQTLYLSAPTGLIRSPDRGQTWSPVITVPEEDSGRFTVAAAAGVVYAALHPWAYEEPGRFYASLDGGEHWAALPGQIPGAQLVFAAAPGQAGWLYAGLEGFGVYRSTDGGATWQANNQGLDSEVKMDRLAVSPANPERVYGVARRPRPALLRSEDGGQTWGEPLLGVRLYDLVVHPQNSELVWAAGLAGLWESPDGGKHWQLVSTLEGWDLSVSPAAPDQPCLGGYAAEDGCLLCRSAAGPGQEAAWRQIGVPGLRGVNALALSPTRPDLIFAGGWLKDSLDLGSPASAIYRSPDGGTTWEKVFQAPPGIENYMPYSLAVSGASPARVLAVFGFPYTGDLAVYQGLEDGRSWARVEFPQDAAGLNQGFARLDVPPGVTDRAPVVFDASNTAYLAQYSSVMRQSVFGQAWSSFGTVPDTLHDLALLPGAPGELLAAGEARLWKRQLPETRALWFPRLVR